MQGYDITTCFPGSRLEQAYLILAEPERQVRHAIAEANGFVMEDGPLLPGGMMIVFGDDDGQHQEPVVFQGYSPRWPTSD